MCLVALSTTLFAQQDPAHSLYVINSYLVNPAVGGIESYMDMRLGHRSQWSGLRGAPQTTYFSLHTPLSIDKARPVYANPVKKDFNSRMDHTNTVSRRHHSVGGVARLDQTGNFQRYLVNGSYSYHLPVSKKYMISMGVSGGFQTQSIDQESLKLSDQNDPIATAGEVIYNPDLNLGLWLYSKNFYMGLSGLGILDKSNSYFGTENENYEASYYFISGVRLQSPFSKLQYIPSVMVRYNELAPMVVEGSLKMIYDQKFWGGAVVKSNEAMALFLGIGMNSTFDFTYSFDYAFTDTVDRVTSGTHEIVLGIRLNNKLKLLCPENLW